MVQLVPEREFIGFALVGAWLGYVAYWLEWHRKPLWLYAVLTAKLLGAWAFGWVYASYYCHGDTLKAYLTAGRLAHYLWSDPATGVALLFRELSSEWNAVGWKVFWQDIHLYGYDYEWSEPSNYLFYRLLVPAYVAAGGSYYGMQGVIALLSGLLSYAAYRRWTACASLPKSFWGIWFLWPSTIFWTSGALRDSIAVPLLLYGSAWLASVRRWRDGWGIGALVLLAGLRLEALPIALAVGLPFRWASHRLVIGATAAVALVALATIVGPWAYQYRIEALDPSMHPEVEEASLFHLHFEPTVWGSFWGWIQALLYSWVGPLPWQIHKPLVLLYAIEVWVSTFLVAYWGIKAWRHQGWDRRALLLLCAGLYLVGGIAMAMPYWGTLARQRLYGMYWIALGVGMAVQKGTERQQDALRKS